MASLYGPYQISGQFQVKLPRKLARELRFEAGDEFHWRQSDDEPGVLMLVPQEVVERRYEAGRAAELERLSEETRAGDAVAPTD